GPRCGARAARGLHHRGVSIPAPRDPELIRPRNPSSPVAPPPAGAPAASRPPPRSRWRPGSGSPAARRDRTRSPRRRRRRLRRPRRRPPSRRRPRPRLRRRRRPPLPTRPRPGRPWSPSTRLPALVVDAGGPCHTIGDVAQAVDGSPLFCLNDPQAGPLWLPQPETAPGDAGPALLGTPCSAEGLTVTAPEGATLTCGPGGDDTVPGGLVWHG